MSTIRGYHQLLAVIRTRKESLGMSDKDLEHIAELTAGHWSKIAAGTKSLGPLSLGRILRALSLELVAQENKVGEAEVAELFLPRDESQVRKREPVLAMPSINRAPWLFTRRRARKAREIQMQTQTPEKRSEIAKRAAAARWEKRKA